MRGRSLGFACSFALALVATPGAARADEPTPSVSPSLHAGDALGLAIFGDGKVAYERAQRDHRAIAATTDKPAPPAKIADEDE